MTKIIGYAYEAATHCVDCARKRFAATYTGLSDGHDEHGIDDNAIDRENNPIHPIFSIDETPPEGEYCHTCFAEISPPWPHAVRCESCGWTDDALNGNNVKDLNQRVEPGEVMPACECPSCGALCHLIKRPVPDLSPLVVVVRGGLVVEILWQGAPVEVRVLDYDNEAAGEPLDDFTDADNKPVTA